LTPTPITAAASEPASICLSASTPASFLPCIRPLDQQLAALLGIGEVPGERAPHGDAAREGQARDPIER
jgi:hypothetical protein